MRRVLILAFVFAWVLPAASASAHVEGTGRPVVFLSTSSDCAATFGKMKARIEAIKYGEKTFQDVTCQPAAGSAQDFRNAARSFAQWAADKYGDDAFDVVSEGQSGLALRYALAHNGDEGWPKLNVEDAVTVGTPHDQLTDPGTEHPEGTRGTDWSAIGSDGDDTAKGDRAIAMDADHKTTYKDTGLTHQKLLDDDSEEQNARVVHSHEGGKPVVWNKAPHAADRVAEQLYYGVDSCGTDESPVCATQCTQKVAEWSLTFGCPGAAERKNGVKDIQVEAPGGAKVAIPSVPAIDYATPVVRRRLLKPIILPDLRVSAGGFSANAYENWLDDKGLTVGTAVLEMGRFGTASAYDLTVGSDGQVKAGALEFEALGGQLYAEKVEFRNGIQAQRATLGFASRFGGGSVDIADLRISGNSVAGRVSGGELRMGDMTVTVKDGQLTQSGFRVGSATLKLPPYLGVKPLSVKDLEYDGNSVSFSEATGGIAFKLAGGKVGLDANVKLTLDGAGGYAISGDGHVTIPNAFSADATIAVESIRCAPAPGPCENAAFLHEASLTIRTDRPIPLGQTGLAINQLGGAVQSSQRTDPKPYRDKDGNIDGVTYTFSINAGLVSYPSDKLFGGTVEGSLSTNGNFGLGLTNAKVFRFLDLSGGMCVLFSPEAAEATCKRYLSAENLAQAKQAGAYVQASVGAGVSFNGPAGIGRFAASLRADAFGRFIWADGQSSIDAQLKGTFTASGSLPVFGDLTGGGSLTARAGRFRAPGDETVVGIKGSVEGSLRSGSRSWSVTRSIFVDTNGNYTEENVDQFTPAKAAMGHAPAGAHARPGDTGQTFELPPRQTQTVVTVASEHGSPTLELTTPRGQRIVVPSPGAMQVAERGDSRADRAELANIHSVETDSPHRVSVYLPEAAPGRWAASVGGVGADDYQLDVIGNKPAPRLKVTRPAPRRPLKVARAGQAVNVAGTLRGGKRGATVSLYSGAGRCPSRDGALTGRPGGEQLVASGIRVHGGAWRYRWRTRGLPAGRYAIYAELDNGTGPLVVGCSKGEVVVKAKRASRARKRKRPARRKARLAPLFQRVAPASHVSARTPAGDCKAPVKEALIPTFTVDSNATPQIARNDAAAISGRDPVTNDLAMTADPGKDDLVRYLYPKTKTAPFILQYGRLTPGVCDTVRPQHYRETCGAKHFQVGKKPGPTDKKAAKPVEVSCDEYPFASSIEGGTGSITRGVTGTEQNRQGGQISSFLQGHREELQKTGGKYKVCVPAPSDGSWKGNRNTDVGATGADGTCPPR